MNSSSFDQDRLILRGIHLPLTAAMREIFTRKVSRLLRHQPNLLRVRIDVGVNQNRPPLYSARGRLELAGPDMTATVTTENAYKSVDLLIDKLDRMLRKRSAALGRTRTSGDIRQLVPEVAPLG